MAHRGRAAPIGMNTCLTIDGGRRRSHMNTSALIQKDWNPCHASPCTVISARVACLQPGLLKTIADPAFGTGGLFLRACNGLAILGTGLGQNTKAAFEDVAGARAPSPGAKSRP
jgi:hypothetical protein